MSYCAHMAPICGYIWAAYGKGCGLHPTPHMVTTWGFPYGMYICVQYDCQKVVSVRYLFSIIMCSICIQYDSICVPYGIHMVYILVTHMECTDVYHMEDLYGAHVVSI